MGQLILKSYRRPADEPKLQGRISFRGLDIAVENKKGSVRSGTGKDGEKWRTKMFYPYGYIRGSMGVDGDPVDVYVGPNQEADNVYIIHQKNPETGKYDEDKCMLGFDDWTHARDAYLAHYDSQEFLGKRTIMPFEEFKTKVMRTEKKPGMLKSLRLLLGGMIKKSQLSLFGGEQGELFTGQTRNGLTLKPGKKDVRKRRWQRDGDGNQKSEIRGQKPKLIVGKNRKEHPEQIHDDNTVETMLNIFLYREKLPQKFKQFINELTPEQLNKYKDILAVIEERNEGPKPFAKWVQHYERNLELLKNKIAEGASEQILNALAQRQNRLAKEGIENHEMQEYDVVTGDEMLGKETPKFELEPGATEEEIDKLIERQREPESEKGGKGEDEKSETKDVNNSDESGKLGEKEEKMSDNAMKEQTPQPKDKILTPYRQLVESTKKPKSPVGAKIKFIRFGKPVKNSINWIDNSTLDGMSVYELNDNGSAKQIIRGEFAERDDVYIGEGEIIGYGSDDEPLVASFRTRKAKPEEVEKAKNFGVTRKELLDLIDKKPPKGYKKEGKYFVPEEPSQPIRTPNENEEVKEKKN